MTLQSCKSLANQEQALKIFGYILILGGDYVAMPEKDTTAIYLTVENKKGTQKITVKSSSSNAHFKLSKYAEVTADEVISQLHQELLSKQ